MAVRRRIRRSVLNFYGRNKDWLLVLLSQLLAVFMHGVAKVLETEESAIHPLQILTIRMIFTLAASVYYLRRDNPHELPLGEKRLRPLLLLRGLAAAFSAIGFYYSLIYLPLAEATVLHFLAPMGACCSMVLISSGSFSLAETVSGILSLVGVVLIAQPAFLFGSEPGAADSSIGGTAIGVSFALMGAVGGMGTITTIRVIGKRAHPLIGVCYYAAAVLFINFICFIIIPSLSFNVILSRSQWMLLLLMAVFGFLMECAFVVGLSTESSHRATYMIYSQAVIAFLIDSVIWGITPDFLSLFGCFWILLALTITTIFTTKESPQSKEEEKD